MTATNPKPPSPVDIWQQHRAGIEQVLTKTFRQHALNNRGFLAATSQAAKIANQIYDLSDRFLKNKLSQTSLAETVYQLAENGLAVTTGAALMQALTQAQAQWLASVNGTSDHNLLADFQIQFMTHLAQGREQLQQEIQEKAQQALQQALHTQLQQQSKLGKAQEKRNQNLRHIMDLNAQLTLLTDESALLNAAVSGICQTLDLEDVTFYEVYEPDRHWRIRTTTAPYLEPGHDIPAEIRALLAELPDEGWVTHRHEAKDGRIMTTYALVLQTGSHLFGAMVANSVSQTGSLYTPEEFVLLLQAFSQNLATLWRNAALLAETTQRARELEILHGRYVDSTWGSDKTLRQAEFSQNRLRILNTDEETADNKTMAYPLQMADFPFGQIQLPATAPLDLDTHEFVEAVAHEMASALSNAQLLQTTRLYSNQLSVAAEVSRAATTYLDRDRLIAEVVELIRSRFGLYYVGLFLVDEGRRQAILHAGTGEAGRIQIEKSHRLPLDGRSMVSQAINQNQIQVAHDVTQFANFKANPLLPDTRSELALPLRARGRTIGVLTVQSIEVGTFTDETITVLQSLADQLAIAIDNAGLFAQTQATLKKTSDLYETSRQLSQALDPESTYQVLIDFARQSKLGDIVQIVSQEEAEDDLYLVTHKLWCREGVSFRPPRRYAMRDLAPYNQPSEAGPIVILADSQNEPSLNDDVRHLLRTFNVSSTALLPILTEGRWLATIILHRVDDGPPFTAQELEALRTLADQSATILANQQLFAEIQEANEQLRQLDLLKTQFLANMSHELRTPLNSIIGFSRVILKGIDGPITPAQEEDLTSIYNNGQHLLMLINEILDMAKIEAGKMTLSFETVDLAETAHSAINTVRNLIEEKGLLLTADIGKSLPAIEADPIRLKQILINLLSNAAKYTDEGSIALSVEMADAEHIRIAVSDTGIGVAPEDYDTLFRAFEQIDNSTTRTVGGTGLGLPITKWMVNMHHGDIWFESELGQGTTFYVKLPVYQPTVEEYAITFIDTQV
jgi:signal transduction histidine kinase/putative methionine-R-sulfoxide reductase with GAF domain